MKHARILLALAVALLIAIPAVAQEKPKRKGRPGKLSPVSRAMLRMDTLRRAIEGLDLSAEQQQKLGKVREAFRAQMKETFGKLRDLLTDQQRDAAEQAARQAREVGKKGRAFFVAVEAAIALSDEQKEKVDKVAPEIVALQRKMVREISTILTPEQREKVKAALAPKRAKAKKAGAKKEKGEQ